MKELRWRIFRYVSWIWLLWERLWIRFHPLTRIQPESLFEYRQVGGILELHLDGRRLAAVRRDPGYSGFKVIHGLREDLAVIADRVRAGELGWMTAIKGTSLMGGIGPVVGFEARAAPRNLGTWLEQYFLVGLDALYHPRGLRPRTVRRWPVESWMSVDELLKRYPAKSDKSIVAR